MRDYRILPVTVAVAVLCLLPPLIVIGQELPGSDGGVVLELDNAVLTITLRSDGEPSLRTSLLGGEVAEERPVEELLALLQQGDELQVHRRDPEAAGQRLGLDLVLEPGLGLAIRGSDLEIELRVEPSEPDGGETAEAPVLPDEDAGEPRPLGIEVSDSTVQLTGIDRGRVVASRSSVQISESSGLLQLQLSGGVTEVNRHWGSLQLAGDGAEVRLDTCQAKLELNLRGGDLVAANGRGRAQVQVNEGRLQLNDWQGQLVLHGDDADLSVLDSRGEDLNLKGRSNTVRIERWAGKLTVQQVGGSLDGRGWQGAVNLSASDAARVDLAGVHGELVLGLSSDADCRLHNLQQELQATVQGASLELDGMITSLALTARDARVTGHGIRAVKSLDARSSELSLDLSTLRGKVSVALHEGTRAELQLATPCQVVTRGQGARFGENTTVSGCDLRFQGQGRPLARRGMEGERPVNLQVLMDEGTELRVDGHP